MLDTAIQKYNGSSDFRTNHAIIITFFFMAESDYYQIAIATDGDYTYVVMNFLFAESGGYHGVSNPNCRNRMVNLYSKEEFDFSKNTNNGVLGQFVYPLTHRICLGKQ